MLLDGFEEAILGTDIETQKVIYDYNKCIEIIVARDEVSREHATEFIDYNVLGIKGEGSPIFISLL